MEKFFINLFPVLVYASSGSDSVFHSHILSRVNTLVTGHLRFQYLIFQKWSGKRDWILYGFLGKMINMEGNEFVVAEEGGGADASHPQPAKADRQPAKSDYRTKK